MSGDRLIQKYIFFFLILGIAVVIVTNLTSFIAAGLGATIFLCAVSEPNEEAMRKAQDE
jgi:hypothetical protein